MVDSDALKIGVLVGTGMLVMLFAGWVVSYVSRFLARAITGGVIILLAAGLGYAAYQLYNGWQAAEPEHTSAESADIPADEYTGPDSADVKNDYVDGDVDEEELEAELEELLTEGEA